MAPLKKSKKMRLFLGIGYSPSTAVRRLLDELQSVEQSQAREFKTTPVGNLHVTLKFLGPVPEAEVTRLIDVMESGVSAREPFAANLSGPGCFSNSLWLGLEKNEQWSALCEMAAELEAGMASAGFPPETRSYRPHLTVARFKPGLRLKLSELMDRYSGVNWGTLPVHAIHLYRSETLSEGPRYSILHTVKLKTSPAD
ncbi:MAG: RNA 2',3'-cyclic phosphodiesterase [Pseudohongiellaceae bacterium]